MFLLLLFVGNYNLESRDGGGGLGRTGAEGTGKEKWHRSQ